MDTDRYCNKTPAGTSWPVCHSIAGHDGNHESADFWWQDGDMAPRLFRSAMAQPQDGCNDAAGSKVAQVRSGLDLPDQSQSNPEGQR